MTAKRIWLISIVCGLFATGLIYVLLLESENKPDDEVVVTDKTDEDKEPVTVEENVEEVKEEVVNEVIPISAGKRAMTIAVTDVQGVAGLVSPGSYVDVVAVMQVPEEQAEFQHDSASLFLQNVKVLAIGHAADDDETVKRYQMVTVEVTPEEGLKLGFSTRYELYLMLRQDGDKTIEPDHTHIHEDDLHEGVFK